ncbi:hypothetical protein MPTK1_5g10300 [Marchantia polymorpha subsp. ruderalis]|uniref:Uncharacterized protein n=2 Tax=Marchantia polymorpha TaxID=3197 RepID=A0AAF6BGW4_MARPO|nr:hypothetical protein MARPO_0048s0042 [Marchantia polymorpha]BBN11248.1 hypothetical protein Mp_5g10300 [Marchantia polymorpha subsp. ruderalis]|eukprot:PTQ38922.1 hypothetical protein MARPO_0048s0042 [Marchantia polymorpha]
MNITIYISIAKPYMKFSFHMAPQWLFKYKKYIVFYQRDSVCYKIKAYESILIFTILASANFTLKKL